MGNQCPGRFVGLPHVLVSGAAFFQRCLGEETPKRCGVIVIVHLFSKPGRELIRINPADDRTSVSRRFQEGQWKAFAHGRAHKDPGIREQLVHPFRLAKPIDQPRHFEVGHIAEALPQPGVKPGASAPNRFYMYGVIGRLAMVAASYELEATDPDAEIYD